jgi:hypothetical protein
LDGLRRHAWDQIRTELREINRALDRLDELRDQLTASEVALEVGQLTSGIGERLAAVRSALGQLEVGESVEGKATPRP